MIPSIGFSEMLLLAVLAIIFVGPAQMPTMMRTLGQWVGKIKAMGQEFKDAFEEMGRDGEMAELRKEIEELKKMGKLEEFGDEDLAHEMSALDNDIRAGTSLDNHPRVSPKASSSDAASDKGGPDGKT